MRNTNDRDEQTDVLRVPTVTGETNWCVTCSYRNGWDTVNWYAL